MRLALVVLGIVAGIAASQAFGDFDASDRKSRCCERYCLEVSPTEGARGTVFRVEGRAWRPRRVVKVVYGPYCEGDCPDIGKIARVRAGSRGGFVFRFRDGQPRSGDLAAGVVAGNGPPVFEQWSGRPHRSRLVRREARYELTP
jgi:hypothetical protein